MSAGAYINKIRVRAQAQLVKVQYPGGRATNFNPIYSALGCNADFTRLNYQAGICCPLAKITPIPPPPICPPPPDCSTVDAGTATTENICVIDGGMSGTEDLVFIGGGGAFGDSCVSCVPPPSEILYGGTSTSAEGCILDGDDSTPQFGPVLNGGNSST
jgi:hypothetical protein